MRYEQELATCEVCGKVHEESDIAPCRDCGKGICPDCGVTCDNCNTEVCNECKVVYRGRDFCPGCHTSTRMDEQEGHSEG